MLISQEKLENAFPSDFEYGQSMDRRPELNKTLTVDEKIGSKESNQFYFKPIL